MALASAVLLILSFPNFNQPRCAWVALVPWLVGVRGMTSRQAFGWSYVVGLVFFLGSIWWLAHVTLIGLIVLCAYLALYFGVFGWLAHRLIGSRFKVQGFRGDPCRLLVFPCPLPLFLLPSAWVTLEYLRSHLLSGFGWNLLGYSQTPALSVIQLADVTGVWGVSFVVVLVNVAIADYLSWRRIRRGMPAVLCAAGCIVAVWLYGQWRLARPQDGTPVKIAVIQGNIPQEEKWDEAFTASILERYERLTREVATHQPQLIIWPETSVPGLLGLDEPLTRRVEQLGHSVQTPTLVGAPMSTSRRGLVRLTNSAALLQPDGSMTARYDKLHLVPFGEFVPFEGIAPWLRDVLPPIGDFVPGQEYTVFHVGSRLKAHGDFGFRISDFGLNNSQFAIRNSQFRFSVLICFEDIFPGLARQFVRRGAQLLTTITNDAWFGNSAAAYQHAQASTFRAVELRVPMVRAANTGWSGCIDSNGRWLASVRDPEGKELFVEGTELCEVSVGETDSVYRHVGDWFAWLCLGGCLGWSIFAIIIRR